MLRLYVDNKCIVETQLNLPSNQTPATTPPMMTTIKNNRRGPLLFGGACDLPPGEDTLDASLRKEHNITYYCQFRMFSIQTIG